MATNEHHHEHVHEHEDGTFGMALGFRTLEEGGKLFLAEAEIAPYVDEPEELGVTLLFHPLSELDPSAEDDTEWPAWPIDIDEDLTRSSGDSIRDQFQAILRQLHGLSNEQLLQYMHSAREEASE